MSSKGEEGIFGADFPDLDGVVVAGGGEAFAVGGPGDGIDPVGVAAIDVDVLVVGGVPGAHGLIVAGGGDLRAVGGPCYAGDAAGVTGTDEERVFSRLRLGGLFLACGRRGGVGGGGSDSC